MHPTSLPSFWDWFITQEQEFRQILLQRQDVQNTVLLPIRDRLWAWREGIQLLVGLEHDGRADLVFTAEGSVKLIPFVEELVAAAPTLPGWKFTAHKPALDIEQLQLEMEGWTFNKDNLHFVPLTSDSFPDQVELQLLYKGYAAHAHDLIANGALIFVDHLLGEMRSAMAIDHISLVEAPLGTEQVPIGKLGDYLDWRQKEFIEKYEGEWHNSDQDEFGTLEATMENGMPLMVVVNASLLEWDRKASHPWMLVYQVAYKCNESGFPEPNEFDALNAIDDEVTALLTEDEGNLFVARMTGNHRREVFMACKDFRKAARVMHGLAQRTPSQLALTFDLFKDKYWLSVEQFRG